MSSTLADAMAGLGARLIAMAAVGGSVACGCCREVADVASGSGDADCIEGDCPNPAALRGAARGVAAESGTPSAG